MERTLILWILIALVQSIHAAYDNFKAKSLLHAWSGVIVGVLAIIMLIYLALGGFN